MSTSSSAALSAMSAAADSSAPGKGAGADLSPLLNDMFAKLAQYANAEIAASGEEYELLEKLNGHASKKYANMAEQAVKLVSALGTVNATQASLDVFFGQIDELERNLTELEQVVSQLDLYSKRLHYTFQQVYSK